MAGELSLFCTVALFAIFCSIWLILFDILMVLYSGFCLRAWFGWEAWKFCFRCEFYMRVAVEFWILKEKKRINKYCGESVNFMD